MIRGKGTRQLGSGVAQLTEGSQAGIKALTPKRTKPKSLKERIGRKNEESSSYVSLILHSEKREICLRHRDLLALSVGVNSMG